MSKLKHREKVIAYIDGKIAGFVFQHESEQREEMTF